MCSGPGRLADRSVHEDGQPYMSEGFKQKALQLLVMAVNQRLLDEKSFQTHKNMVQILGGRCIRIYQIRRPQEPAPVAAVADSLGDMICGTGTSQPQPLPTVLMSDSLSRQSQDHPVPVNCEPFHSAGLPASTVLCTASPTSSLASHRARSRRSRSLRPVATNAGPLGLPRCWRLESRSCVSGLVYSFIVGRSAPSLV